MQRAESSNPRSVDLRVLLLAVILGVVAAGLIVAYLGSRDSGGEEAEAAVPTLSVVVAAEDIKPGATITDEMLELKALPETAVIANAATAKSQVVGQTLRYPVAEGEQLSNLRLVDVPKVQTLSFQIPEGMRGFTIPVSVSSSPAALLTPGDFVDVLVSVDAETIELPEAEVGAAQALPVTDTSGGDLQVAATLLQNVQVMTVEREYVDNGVPYEPSVRGEPPEEDSVSYVTLAVTPEQAQTLWLAGREGQMTITLRAFGDDEILDLDPATEPLRLEQPAPEPAPAPAPELETS